MIVNVFKGSVPRREVWRKEARLNIFTRKLSNAKKAYRVFGMLMTSGRWIQKGGMNSLIRGNSLVGFLALVAVDRKEEEASTRARGNS